MPIAPLDVPVSIWGAEVPLKLRAIGLALRATPAINPLIPKIDNTKRNRFILNTQNRIRRSRSSHDSPPAMRAGDLTPGRHAEPIGRVKECRWIAAHSHH